MSRPWEQPYSERFAGRLPKVFVGFVAFGDIDPQILESTAHWCFQAGSRYSGVFEIHWGCATRREQYRARNTLVEEAQKQEADFLLMLDDDHLLSDCPDILGHFFREEKPMQGGLYVQRREDKSQPVIVKYDEAKREAGWCSWDEVPVDGGPVDVLGGGVNWCDMTIFDFLKQPHWWPYPADRREVTFLPDQALGLDLQLSIGCKKLGIQPWLNGNVRVGHMIHERTVLRPPQVTGPVECTACGGLASSTTKGEWECMTCKAQLRAA